MAMRPSEGTWLLMLCVVAVLTATFLFVIARLLRALTTVVASRMSRLVPRRVSNVIAVVVTALLVWSVASNFIVRTALNVLDSSFAELDRLFEPEQPRPADPEKTGGTHSLIGWEELGRTGRRYVASGPSAEEIRAFTGRPALAPVRVYVGLRGADTAKKRAELALKELQRQGGFDRANLVVITPTGTGWVDPSAIDSVEFLHHGDVASVAVQYSYLNSPLSLLVQPDLGAEAARALFLEIYRYWTSLPRDKRPKLYLHGLSLGALNSEKSVEFFEILSDPINGALWSGSPFGSRLWRSFTEGRNEGSPAWLPTFGNGQLVRFMNQGGATLPKDTPWEPLRIVYLQYASDPITFFDLRIAYHPPAWLADPRGPDVSPSLRWFPIVTMLQVAIDMGFANNAPMGFGHVFAPEHYTDAWVTLTDPPGWTQDQLARLKKYLASEARKPDTDLAPAYEDRGG
ncbi:putative membrane protein [Nitrobacter winogradskyi]|nr:putative membrane protein [Nitrobacter winogradskyi]